MKIHITIITAFLCAFSSLEAVRESALPELLACEKLLQERNTTIPELITKGQSPRGDEQFPYGGAIDGDFFYFYHSHRANEIGHIHTFIRSSSIPGRSPLICDIGEDSNDSYTAPIALSFDKNGKLKEFFTTNLSVTGGCWYSADQTLKGTDHFRPSGTRADPLVDRWISAVFATFADEIALILKERDQSMEKAVDRYGRQAYWHDSTEIPSRISVQIPDQKTA